MVLQKGTFYSSMAVQQSDSPSMNFSDVTVEGSSACVLISNTDLESLLPTSLSPVLHTLDIQSEDFEVTDDTGHIDTGVEVVEPIGADSFLCLQTSQGDQGVTARVPTEFLPQQGESLPLTFGSEETHFFDTSEGVRRETERQSTVNLA